MLSLGVDQLLLVGAAIVTVFLHQRHEAAVDALPEPDRGGLRVLLREQRLALVMFLLIVPVELARGRLFAGSVPASAVPAAMGMAAAFELWRVRRHVYRIYELAADDDNQEQVRRAHVLARHALVAFCASAVLWGGLLVYKLT